MATSNEPLLLDTHVWIRSQLYPELLRAAARERIRRAAEANLIYVSVISVWEIAMLIRDGKLELDGGADGWTKAALSCPGIFLLPFSREIAIASVYLPQPMHKDPSDRSIVASALIAKLTLVTADKAVLAYAKTTGLSHLRA